MRTTVTQRELSPPGRGGAGAAPGARARATDGRPTLRARSCTTADGHGARLAPGATATPMNAAAVLLGNGEPQHPALVCGGERVTYDALRDAVARAASAWRQRGRRAAASALRSSCPTACAWVSAFLGTIWAGGVAVAVNPRIPADEWQFILGEPGSASSSPSRATTRRRRFASAWSTLADWLRDAQAAAPVAPEPMDAEAPALLDPLVGNQRQAQGGRARASLRAPVERVAAELLGVTRRRSPVRELQAVLRLSAGATACSRD